MTGDTHDAVNGAAGVTDRIRVESFEYNLTEHCNLRCSGCDHASPFLKERFASVDEFQRDLRQLATALCANEIKLVGGEPLLHPQLLQFARVAKETGSARLVTLVTNGVLLHQLDERVWDTIDRLWISIYPGVKIRADLTEIQRTADRHHVELWQKRNTHFRVTLLNHPHHDPNLVREIFAKCGLAHEFSCHTLYDGRYYRCSPAPFIEPRLAARGVTFANRLADSVPIHDNPELRTALAAYLSAENPLAGCSYCLGTTGARRLHRQLSGTGLAAELSEDHSDPTPLIDVELLRVKPRDVWPPEIANKPPWDETRAGPS